jgi:hypothetical protein
MERCRRPERPRVEGDGHALGRKQALMTMATMDLIGEEDGRQRRRDNNRRVRGRGLGTGEGRGCFRAWRREAERVAHEGREREEEGQTIRVGGGKNGGIGEEADGGGGRARVERKADARDGRTEERKKVITRFFFLHFILFRSRDRVNRIWKPLTNHQTNMKKHKKRKDKNIKMIGSLSSCQ